MRHAGRKPVHEGHVGARPTHVERDDVLDAGVRRDPDRAGDPAHRPGEERPRAALRGRGEGHRAAVGAHDVDRGRDVAFEQSLLEHREIGAHHRREVGVQDRRRGALELAALRCELGGCADRGLGQAARELPCHGLFVRVVDVAVDERYRDRLHALCAQRRGQRVEVDAVQRPNHRAVRGDALRDFQPAVPGDEWGGPLPLGVEQPSHQAPPLADLEQIAEALGGHQAGRRALALQQRVGGDGRPVHERPDRRRLDPERGERVEHAPPLLARQRRHLGRMHHPTGAVGDEVRERTPHVHADSIRGFRIVHVFLDPADRSVASSTSKALYSH